MLRMRGAVSPRPLRIYGVACNVADLDAALKRKIPAPNGNGTSII